MFRKRDQVSIFTLVRLWRLATIYDIKVCVSVYIYIYIYIVWFYCPVFVVVFTVLEVFIDYCYQSRS